MSAKAAISLQLQVDDDTLVRECSRIPSGLVDTTMHVTFLSLFVHVSAKVIETGTFNFASSHSIHSFSFCMLLSNCSSNNWRNCVTVTRSTVSALLNAVPANSVPKFISIPLSSPSRTLLNFGEICNRKGPVVPVLHTISPPKVQSQIRVSRLPGSVRIRSGHMRVRVEPPECAVHLLSYPQYRAPILQSLSVLPR